MWWWWWWQEGDSRIHHCMKICDLQTIKPALIQGLVARETFVKEMLNLSRFPINSKKFDLPWIQIQRLVLNFELGLFVKWEWGDWKACFKSDPQSAADKAWFQGISSSFLGFIHFDFEFNSSRQIISSCESLIWAGKLSNFYIHSQFLFLALKVFHFSPFWKNRIICSCKSVIWTETSRFSYSPPFYL